MEKIEIIVASHKIFDKSILPKGYQVVKVGNKVSDDEAKNHGYQTDNEGENISFQNPWYCELTAHYWAWKNLKCDICGLVHYRRYFMSNKFSAKTFKDDILTESQIKKILKRYKVIVPYFAPKPNDTMTLHKGMPKDKDNRDWVIFENIIKKYYPEILPSFNRIVYSSVAWGLNMIITTKSVFDEYSMFLFDVLGKWDKELEKRGIVRRPRVDGYYSETLMCVWIMAKFHENEIYRADVRNIELDDAREYYSMSMKSILKRAIKSVRCFNNTIHKVKLYKNSVPVNELPHLSID